MSSNIYDKIKVAQFIRLSQNLHQCTFLYNSLVGRWSLVGGYVPCGSLSRYIPPPMFLMSNCIMNSACLTSSSQSVMPSWLYPPKHIPLITQA